MGLSARAVAVAASMRCPRLDALAQAGHSDTAVAKSLGVPGKNPRLAYAVGVAFENRVTGNHQGLKETLGLDPDTEVFDLGNEELGERTYQRTLELLRSGGATLILQGVLTGSHGGWIRPDILYRGGPEQPWTVGEVKVYLDKGGETNRHSLGQAVVQAALGVLQVRAEGLPASDTVCVVLSTMREAAVAHFLDSAGEQSSISALLRRTLPMAPAAAAGLLTGEHVYSVRCFGSCALEEFCRERAREAGAVFPSLALASELGVTDALLASQARDGVGPVAAGYGRAQPLL